MRRAFVSQARRAAFDPAKRRSAWLALLEQAEALGDRVAAGGAVDRDTATTFAGMAIRTGDLAFPLPYESARTAAGGFRLLARGFIAAAVPEIKAALAPAMAQAARTCRRLIDMDTEAAAAAMRRRTGEREED